MPTDISNRDFWANNMNINIEKLDLPYKNPEVLDALQKVSERHGNFSKTTSKRNQAHVCSFFVQGKCNRGKACPYRHDNITEEDLKSMQKGHGSLEDKIKSRYSGKNDPLATKIIEKVHEFKIPDPPEDLNITTLFIGGINDESPEKSLTEQFEMYGKIQGFRIIPSKNCGFISFVERQACEKAFNTLYERLYLKNTPRKLKLLWAKSQLDESQIKKKKNKKNAEKVVQEKTTKTESKEGAEIDNDQKVN